MQRWFRAFILLLVLTGAAGNGLAQQLIEVSGRIAPNEVRFFYRNNTYRINGTLMVAGTLVVEPGSTVEFTDNGRLIDSVGGRIIADGRLAATYTPGANPRNVVNPRTNDFYKGYADIEYFGRTDVVTATTAAEPTIQKRDLVFRVNLDPNGALDTVPVSRPYPNGNPLNNLTIEKALIYKLSRIENVATDPNLNNAPWSRFGSGTSINITPARITFRGRPQNTFSREWGHIIVLPGARAAFFRDVDFQNFRKDTTVDRFPVYVANNVDLAPQLNAELTKMSNGSGSALTTFSSRTWVVNCSFRNNLSRYHGGAVQFLQAPLDNYGANGSTSFYPNVDVTTLPFYDPNVANNNITDPVTGNVINQQIRAIDLMFSPTAEPLTDAQRQSVDDGRLAVYLGRVRQVTFQDNQVLLSTVGPIVNTSGTVVGIGDQLNVQAPTDGNNDGKNEAFGGAVYISGRTQMKIGFGMNSSFDPSSPDYAIFERNIATNLQGIAPVNGRVTRGARGGAVYIGGATSVVFTSRFANNETRLGFNPNVGDYSQGGAVYGSAGAPQIEVRSSQLVRAGAEMYFLNNKSGRGGAIYSFMTIPTNPVNITLSPVIGGSNTSITTRNYGFDIRFIGNEAVEDGGAIYTNKRFSITGAGGTVGTFVNYGGDNRVVFRNNKAGLSGGAITQVVFSELGQNERQNTIERALFDSNSVGIGIAANQRDQIKGGGAIYLVNGNLVSTKATEFSYNTAEYSNGGAIALIGPGNQLNRYFATDLDNVDQTAGITSFDAPYIWQTTYPADGRSLTRFIGNKATMNSNRMGSGRNQLNDNTVTPTYHPGTTLLENGTGLGGALYILDNSTPFRNDRFEFNRARFESNEAYSGAVVYSDNYNLKVVFNRSLIVGNVATSTIGRSQDVIEGPFVGTNNPASSDLAGAIIYGEVLGPIPASSYSVAGNAIYDNNARFIVRLPDGVNTKGALALGNLGKGGVDTLRGNYWGRTEANIRTVIPTNLIRDIDALQETFFIAGDNSKSVLDFERNSTDVLKQGPFESENKFNSLGQPLFRYTNIPVGQVRDTLLMEGRIYDLYDKGTDIKTADYSNRRMSRIEDFAVGIPARLREFVSAQLNPSLAYKASKNEYVGKNVKRYTRDPKVAESDANIAKLQSEFSGDHPIGYPLFLESYANYANEVEQNNNLARSTDETVFFVINENTGDFIRLNMQQVDRTSELFRGRVEFVPDSTNRNPVTQVRRTQEGLANFGSGIALLSALRLNASNEDLAALQGRKYELNVSRRSVESSIDNNSGVIYSNERGQTSTTVDPVVVNLPSSNLNASGNINVVTYFAGERYTALPVAAGDIIRVVSRTTLWREGENQAIAKGISFRISTTGSLNSVNLPRLTGSKVALENNQVRELRNLVVVNEDVQYPTVRRNIPGKVDSIFAITAIDTNNFYDPRWASNPDQYTSLEYKWNVEQGSGLSYWLQADTVKGVVGGTNQFYYGANGYVMFKGRPSNPYIVPGGEEVTVSVRNWAPNKATIDTLLKYGFSADYISKNINIYRSYFNAGAYSATNARYMQQDTIDVGRLNTVEYKFKVLVADSIPVFTNNVYNCYSNPGLLVASVTDSLRFSLDLNTDDEAEDLDAATKGWGFRYGKTTYGFQSIARRYDPADTTIDAVYQVRPIWMSNQYLADANGNVNTVGALQDFSEKGIVRVAVPANQLITLLTPANQYNRGLNTDTLVSFIVNDGHSGANTYTSRVLVNFAPTVSAALRLERAKEGQEYNRGLLDSNRRISAYDPNYDQVLKYRLLYAGDASLNVPKDPCYPVAGTWNSIVQKANTPAWLNIDSVSGRLYGTPGVIDAPRLGTNASVVTVLVTDPYGLTFVTTLTLEVDSVNHTPEFASLPAVDCIDADKSYTQTISFKDLDLLRNPLYAKDSVTLTVTKPQGFTVTPSFVLGGFGKADSSFRITGSIPAASRNADGTVDIELTLTDANGSTKTATYKVTLSDPTTFTSTVLIKNQLNAEQTLSWGVAQNATTGLSTDLGVIGQLDKNFCETELPLLPPNDVFDARWEIPKTQGILRSIYPTPARSTDKKRETRFLPLTARFQAGGVNSGGSVVFPIEISWTPASVPDPYTGTDRGTYAFFLQDAGSQGGVFKVNMTNPSRNRTSNNVTVDANGTVRLFLSAVNSFQIVIDSVSSVGLPSSVEEQTTENSFVSVSPNPIVGETNFQFNLSQASKVSVEIYDNTGRFIGTAVEGFFGAGYASVPWNTAINGQGLTSGYYTYRLVAGSTVMNGKFVIVR